MMQIMNNPMSVILGPARWAVALIVAAGITLSPMAVAAEREHGHDTKDAAHGRENPEKPEEGGVKLKPEVIEAQGIVIEPLVAKAVGESLRTAAEVRFNEQRRVVITARASGWAEEVKVFANQRVKKDQLLASLYSPDFLSAQHEYLLILNRVKNAGDGRSETQSLLGGARERLRILGLTDKEIAKLGQTGTPYRYQHIHSPIPGTVIEHKINTGDTVQSGQVLYVIADLRTVWAELALTESQVGKARAGQPVSLTVKAYPGRRFEGRLLSVGANMDETTRTVKARALIENPDRLLKPGMFAEAEVAVGGDASALALPEAAVLRSPDGDWVVFVEEEPGHFKPVEVRIVRNVGDQVVIDGLKPGTRVTTKGAFFIQSELAKSGFKVHNH